MGVVIMRIAVLGTGDVATALGARLGQRGHDVVYGSREPAAHREALAHREAVAGSDLIITAVPGLAVLPTLEAIGEELLADRIVLDPSVAINADFSLAYPNDSLARTIQTRFPRTRVVKTLNTMNISLMIDPLATLDRATVFVSGDDAAAKAQVSDLLGDLGWNPESILDLGGIETATATEHAAPLFFATFMALRTPSFAITIAR